jgi:hypothetical protein
VNVDPRGLAPVNLIVMWLGVRIDRTRSRTRMDRAPIRDSSGRTAGFTFGDLRDDRWDGLPSGSTRATTVR